MRKLSFFVIVTMALSLTVYAQNGKLCVGDNGRVGIGTENPKSTLDVRGHMNIQDENGAAVISFPSTGTYPNLYIRSDDDPSSYEAASERMIIKGDGNVGIGMIPEKKLDVNGDIQTTRGGIVTGVKWTPLSRSLGEIPYIVDALRSYDLSSYLPDDAKEVFVYIWIAKGQNPAGLIYDTSFHYEIYTQEDSTKYIQKLAIRDYKNDSAWVVNSDNMWFPITSNKMLYIILPPGTPAEASTPTSSELHGYKLSSIEIIGYR